MPINDQLGKVWLREIKFETGTKHNRWKYEEQYFESDGCCNINGRIIVVENECSGGYQPTQNVAKYITHKHPDAVYVVHVILPTFGSFPTAVLLARQLADRLKLRYKQIDLRGLRQNYLDQESVKNQKICDGDLSKARKEKKAFTDWLLGNDMLKAKFTSEVNKAMLEFLKA